ncbi:hypothetical protein K7432_008697 [Basidiobolus ranarum]|uniref:V-type proton ATPase subunit S1/VOA1 transmembrane domain-containing protein n=1 Tax=Basidiobolus ranarum TaxID=34480 RepID=A0ABR2WRF6_9FUNG
MHSSRFFKVFAILATSFVASTIADGSVDCPARVSVVLNKQQTSEYLDSPIFSSHKRTVGEDTTHSENIEKIKSNCGAEHLDFANVANLKADSSYVISGTEGAVHEALEYIQNVVKDYVVVLDRKAHLQKRQQVSASPSVSKPAASSSANSIAPSASGVPAGSSVAPGPTENPGKNVSRADSLRSSFWTVGLLTGLLTTVVLVLILLVGICWLASIEGPTRFENVKQKRN